MTIKGGLLGVSAEIQNIGDKDAADINWNISVKGGLFNRIDVLSDGTISTLDADDEKTKKTSKPIFGFGAVHIKVTANASYGGTAEKTEDGRILFFLVQV